MTAAEVLHLALRQLLEHDQRPPCGYSSDQWLSEERQQRAIAARCCQPCPLLALCHTFASTARPRITFGVFAAVDYTATNRKKVAA